MVLVYNDKHQLIKIFNNIEKTSKKLNILVTILIRYKKSTKLYNKSLYLKNSNIKNILYNSLIGKKHSLETKELIRNTLKNRLNKLLPVNIRNLETNIIKSFATNLEAANYLKASISILIRYKYKKILFQKYFISDKRYRLKNINLKNKIL